ncbi:MAG: hypothetical protein EA392_08990 [Cryomorphaceae bacterium]|nr:MAG: hypothetical protein EA392_08990 [Cryomorphaceae bacterium]
MKRFLTRLAVFSAVAIPGYVLAVCIWGLIAPLVLRPNLPYLKGVAGFTHTRTHEILDYGKVDVLVLGSSRAFRGFDTRIFEQRGIRMFNLGTTGQAPVGSLMLAKQYMHKVDPDLVIIEIGNETFTSDGVESGLDLLTNNKIDWHSLVLTLEVNHVKLYNTFIYSLFRQILNLDKDYVEPKKKDGRKYVSGGYIEAEIVHHTPSKYPKERVRKLSKLQKRSLQDLVHWLEDQEKSVLLVEVPTASDRYRTFGNHDEFTNFLENTAPFVSFLKNLNLNDSLHFSDASHLNQYGTEVFNKALINWLTDHGWLSETEGELPVSD